ncbi:ADP-ribosylglycohydrolase [Bifidobacterium dolichotidis]|uniref:ADP-ribosylglycohydrolase n=1 Tax=Bifidobacterium dolichotidis TaxID=2306976 RepID=A0A430FSF1_9BIFI|nr:ADP-ribosylglycohydrolase family protein [Bifidobacterium dolichotidis]RSX55798.1 ADP-ribosylglycohydrolase [Bifidobacterium dolichotidis]
MDSSAQQVAYDRRVRTNLKYLDEFQGCFIGGAAGDAFGYPLEFLSYGDIIAKYGESGLQHYVLTDVGEALISDDTQMTLFTAVGLLIGKTRLMYRGIGASYADYVADAYTTWYDMQMGQRPQYGAGWLTTITELGVQRSPGATCMTVLGNTEFGTPQHPINDRKGCGGIMRIAPVGLYLHRADGQNGDLNQLYETAAEIAALTHGHELGWMPAAMQAHLINTLAYSSDSLETCITQVLQVTEQQFARCEHLPALTSLVRKALEFTQNTRPDIVNIAELGQGWVAEETLAIAIYCAVKYQDDFSSALRAAVNHSGDTDSTGAVTGSILGTYLGYSGIPEMWKQHLECKDVLLKMAHDLCRDCQGTEYFEPDEQWVAEYSC